MKWLSVKKYAVGTSQIVFIVCKNGSFHLGSFDGKHLDGSLIWTSVNGDDIDNVTHFCIPDSIPLEEEE